MYNDLKAHWSERFSTSRRVKKNSVPLDFSGCSSTTFHPSMRYADPWLYGTVRDIPARPLHGQAIFGPMPAEVAVIVCSCPEYLNGTKRSVKKATVCKKCKGSRLPLAPIGGTMRVRETPTTILHKGRPSAGTVRLPPTSGVRLRPTILDPKNDPYDLMRRSRLLSPEQQSPSVVDKLLRNRAKSTSPTRGRSRTRILPPGSGEKITPIPSGSRNRSGSQTQQDRWLENLEHDPGGRRSILHCDVNPYDLIAHSASVHNNEFAPDCDDIFDSVPHKMQMAKIERNSTYPNSLKIAGQSISLEREPTPSIRSTKSESIFYDDVMINGSKKFDEKTFMQTEQNDVKPIKFSNSKKDILSEFSKPKRPPRRKQDNGPSIENLKTNLNGSKLANLIGESFSGSSSSSSNHVINQKQGIKSILKRPSSVTSSMSSCSDTDAKYTSSDTRPDSVTNGDKVSTEINAKIERKSNSDNKKRLHCYFPFSNTRKKVQFMVEDKIIHKEHEDEKSNIAKDISYMGNGNVNSNYNRVEGYKDKQDKILDILQEHSATLECSTVTDTKTKDIKTVAIATTAKKDRISSGFQNPDGKDTQPSVALVTAESSNKENSGSDEAALSKAPSKDITKRSPTPGPRQTHSLRRTNSDRQKNTTTVQLNFIDTTALRSRNSRADCRDVFSQQTTQQSVPSSVAYTKSSPARTNVVIAQVNKTDNTTTNTIPTKKINKKKSLPNTVQTARNQQHNNNIQCQENGIVTIKNDTFESSTQNDGGDVGEGCNGHENIYEDYNVKMDPKVNVILFSKMNKKTQFDHEKEIRNLQSQKEISGGSRIFGNTNKNTQKTVVRVAPFMKSTSEIHRLKISHKDDNNPENVSQRKTSILINGDECYSTMNVNNDMPIYQSSVVVTDGTEISSNLSNQNVHNSVTVNVSNFRTPHEEIIYKNNKINTLLNNNSSVKAVIPIVCENGVKLDTKNELKSTKPERTLITLDFDSIKTNNVTSHEEELVKILRDPVEAVRLNLVPHVCGKHTTNDTSHENNIKSQDTNVCQYPKNEKNSFVAKLLEDPTLSNLAEGLDSEIVIKLIENSLKRLKDNYNLHETGTEDNGELIKLIDISLQKIKDERLKLEASKKTESAADQENLSNRGSVSSANSFSSANYELFDFDNNESDCYQSCSSELTGDEDTTSSSFSKFYQMLVDATLSEIEISAAADEDHHYESIKLNGDPIYEEISDVPPPLPLSPPPFTEPEFEKKNTRSIFEGASKYDILSYLVEAKERGIVREESYEYNFSNTSNVIVEEESDNIAELGKKQKTDISSRISHLSITSDSSEDTSLLNSINDKVLGQCKINSDVQRNDSGVGSETSKSSRSRYQNYQGCVIHKNSPVHLCEDCDGPVETQVTDSGVMYAPLVCRKCSKKRAERKEIITEIVETEEKYGRDLQIILEEFCQPMLVAGLLTQEQLSAIFLNTEELLENNQSLAERMRDALDIAMEQGDDDLMTVNIGKIFLEATPMLHAFESYCIRQASASLLLANLEKEKELLRIFLRVSQMENTVLRRMNLNSFLMVPVQRVTKYPLLLARLYKVTPPQLEGKEILKQSQEKIELHLNHMNQEAKDVPTKLWRRISSSSPNRRASCEIDMINIKLRKLAIDVLEWNHDEVRFAMEGKLLFTQPTESNWKKGRTIKLTPVNALLVTNGKPSPNYKGEKTISDQLNFTKHTGIREASLLLVKEKCGRYTLIREPFYLDRCIVCTEPDWYDYFEVHEISSKDTFMFKAEDGVRTKQWYTQLQYHAQGMGAWRKRRNALANIMINRMLSRT